MTRREQMKADVVRMINDMKAKIADAEKALQIFPALCSNCTSQIALTYCAA